MKETKSRMTVTIAGLLFLALLTVIDQYTKHLAIVHLKDTSGIVLLPGIMELQYLENRGAAFGILQNQQWLFILLFLVFLAVMGWTLHRLPPVRRFFPLRLTILIILAGGIGNLIDRVFRGYVVDFFYFSLIDFPIFNVADIYVTVSVAVLFLLFLFYYQEEELSMIWPDFKKKGN